MPSPPVGILIYYADNITSVLFLLNQFKLFFLCHYHFLYLFLICMAMLNFLF
uniref:Uncharacterized protein n=1 Tax=Oryza brachyantha TaxID=4533 RepID=J3KU01_ORYBR